MKQYAIYERPPVHEVVFSIQLKSRLAMKAFDAYRIHEPFAPRYPEVIEHKPMASITLPLLHSVELEVEEPRARWWFGSEDGSEILQIQDDRFVRNWRKAVLEPAAHYAGYSKLRDQFLDDFSTFESAVSNAGFGSTEIIACELSYVNLVPLHDSANNNIRIRDVVTFLTLPAADPVSALGVSWLHGAERTEDEKGIVRMYKTEFSTGAYEGASVANLTILGVSRCNNETVQTTLDGLHDNLHSHFQELVSEDMQASWNKRAV